MATARKHQTRPRQSIGKRSGFWTPSLRTILRAVAICIAAGFAVIVVFRVSAAGAFENSYPFQAMRLAPRDAVASANMAARLQAAGRLREARILALAALERDHTSVVALRTLGLAAEADGRPTDALHLIGLADALSRRDLPTQLWLITHAIHSGDFEAAVAHFDIAMRTSSWSKEQLIPLLVSATEDERVLPPLSRLLARNPSWKVGFLSQLAALGPRPDHTVRLTHGRLDPAIPEEREAIKSLIIHLASVGQFDLAWDIYHDASRWADAASLRNGNFEVPDRYPPFDWSLAEDPDLSALRISRPDGAPGNALSLIAQNNRAGDVARQVIRLAPGAYRLEFDVGAVPTNVGERPVFSLNCAVRSEQILAFPLSAAREAPQRVSGTFTVPAGCSWQWFSISVGDSGSSATVSPWIDNILIRRGS
jgi:tetratricopeptide (TPR) repeat protein